MSRDEKGRFIGNKGIGSNKNPLCVVYPQDIDAVLRSLPNRSEYIREAVIKQLKEDGLI